MINDLISIPHPYKGFSLRLGKLEINVHEIWRGNVLYGLYDDDADSSPYRCVGTYRKPIDAWIDQAGRAILDGAVLFSRIEADPFCLTGE